MNIDKDPFEDWNERMAERWDFDAYYNTQNPIIRYLERKRTFWTLKFLDPQDTDRILEVGCGAGHILEKISKGNLYGIDLSRRLISIAGRRLGKRAELNRCNAEAIESPDNFFDKVICADIIEHVQNPRRVLEEVRRVNKKDGLVIISIPNDRIIYPLRNILTKLGLFRFLFKNVPKERWDWHLHVFSLPVLRSTTKGIMEEIEIKAIPSLVFPLRYIGKYKVIKAE